MTNYQFVCPLEGCDHMVMKSEAATQEEAAVELTQTAEKHLADMHQEIHKSQDEVAADISANMKQVG